MRADYRRRKSRWKRTAAGQINQVDGLRSSPNANVTSVPFDRDKVPLRLELVLTSDANQDSTLVALTSGIAPLAIRRGAGPSARLWDELWQLEELDESLSLKQGVGLLLLPPSVEGALLNGLSPLAATTAGFLLQRGGMLSQSSTWPKRIMEWHNLVEGAVLWADVLWNRTDRQSPKDLRTA